MSSAPHQIDSLGALRAVFDAPFERSVQKEMTQLEKHSRLFISRAPFVLLATSGPGGADCSPKGDAPGFVQVLDDQTLAIPDRRGNNRLDTLENIVANPEIGLLFMIPGADDTLRINGEATLSTDPALLARFEVKGTQPKIVILVRIRQAYLHCAKALLRSKLWHEESRIDRKSMPSFSRMINEQIHSEPDEEQIAKDEAVYDARNQERLY